MWERPQRRDSLCSAEAASGGTAPALARLMLPLFAVPANDTSQSHLRENHRQRDSNLKVATTCSSALYVMLHRAAWVKQKQTVERKTPQQLTRRSSSMNKTILTLACCALVAPLAVGQTQKKQSTTEEITVTGTVLTTSEEGAAASYQPSKTLIVRKDTTNKAGQYTLNGRGHVFNKKGELVQTAIKPGARVCVYYTNSGDSRTIDHVVVLD